MRSPWGAVVRVWIFVAFMVRNVRRALGRVPMVQSVVATLTIPRWPQPVPERNALEAAFKALLALWLLPIALRDQIPPTLAAAPPWMAIASPWAIIFGGIISLFGLARRDRNDGIPFQQVGLVAVASGLGIYGTALLVSAPSGKYAGGICFAVTVGMLARWWQLQRYVVARRRWRDQLEDAP